MGVDGRLGPGDAEFESAGFDAPVLLFDPAVLDWLLLFHSFI